MRDADLRKRVEELEEQVRKLSEQPRAVDSLEESSDVTWTCDACARPTLLGIIDRGERVVRRKVRDDVSFIALGEGGYITVVCRSCAKPNTIHAAQVDAACDEAAGPGEKRKVAAPV